MIVSRLNYNAFVRSILVSIMPLEYGVLTPEISTVYVRVWLSQCRIHRTRMHISWPIRVVSILWVV